jgi:broad specificity phosphatase PhoE
MLRRILLVRHAQSEEDVEPHLRDRVSDRRISVTDEGQNQVKRLAGQLRGDFEKQTKVMVYSSDTTRASQTMTLFEKLYPNVVFTTEYESSIRNLNWGSVTARTVKTIEQERYRVGVLHYQFPDGDHTPTFVSNVRRFVADMLSRGKHPDHPEVTIVFTHGFALRVLAKELIGMSDNEFRFLKNPPNCFVASFSVSQSGVVVDQPLPVIDFQI